MIEIERKWLVPDNVILQDIGSKIGYHEIRIEQFYIYQSATIEIRCRESVTDWGVPKYTMHTKQTRSINDAYLDREEVIYKITAQDYRALEARKVGNTIVKWRKEYAVRTNPDDPSTSLSVCDDYFMEQLKGLRLIEVEFDSREKAEKFDINSIFKYNGQLIEVTDNPIFNNSHLINYKMTEDWSGDSVLVKM